MSESAIDKWPADALMGLFCSREDILAAAKKAASNLYGTALYDHCVLYYVVRYLVAYYEARFQQIPLQVWNEHRMALDHLMRHLSSLGSLEHPFDDDNGSQLKSMRSHLLRAALDISKFIVYESSRLLLTTMSFWGAATLRLTKVDGGDESLLATVLANRDQAETAFQRAKQLDNDLGKSPENDNTVLGRYLDATFAYTRIIKLIDQHRASLEAAIPEADELTLKLEMARAEATSL